MIHKHIQINGAADKCCFVHNIIHKVSQYWESWRQQTEPANFPQNIEHFKFWPYLHNLANLQKFRPQNSRQVEEFYINRKGRDHLSVFQNWKNIHLLKES